jgi:hypothetical protein
MKEEGRSQIGKEREKDGSKSQKGCKIKSDSFG